MSVSMKRSRSILEILPPSRTDAERQFTPCVNEIAHAVTVANDAEENSMRTGRYKRYLP